MLTTWAVCQAQTIFRHLNTSDGLSHNIVLDLIQDHKGFLWLGTADGLNRYDGQSFQVYRNSPGDARSLSSNEVTCMLEDRQHRLWVGTRSGGVNRLDSSGVHFERLLRTTDGTDISTAAITDIIQDPAGRICVSTHGQGLLLIEANGQRVRRLTAEKNRLPSDKILRMCHGPNGDLWLGLQKGVVARLRLADGSIQRYQLPLQSSTSTGGNIMTLLRDSQGRVWAGSQGWGLFRYDSDQNSFRSVYYQKGVLEGVNIARSLYEDAAGRFWLGTDDGVLVADDSNFERIKQYRSNPAIRHSLSTHATVCVSGDQQGNIWIGTWEGGLNVLFAQPDAFEQHTHQIGQANSIPARNVATVLADEQDNAWIGTTHGLTYIDRKTNTYRHFTHRPGDPNSLSGNDITDIIRLSDRALLVSVWNKGADVFNPQTGRVVRRLTQLKPAHIHCMLSMTGDKAWIATHQGTLWQLNVGTGQLDLIDKFAHNNLSFTAMAETADGCLWIGTFNDGIIEWQRRTGRVVYHRRGQHAGQLRDNHVICLLEDRQKRLWIGTSGGLHRYDATRKKFELISTKDGLPNNSIMSMRQDKHGNVWVATNNGLCRIDEAGRVVRTYRQSDGLPGNDFTERAVSLGPTGTLFLGGKHGLTIFHPDQLENAYKPFPVYLSSLKLFNQPIVPGAPDSPLTRDISETKAITLRHDQSVITFDFAAVLFKAYRNVRYAFRLDGFERDWNYVGSQHTTTYTNLDPGTYQFRVKASLSDDFRQAQETVLQLTILPPWYRTNWAFLLYTVLIAGLVALIRRVIQIREAYKTELRLEHLETEKARELDRLRSGFFTNISHEFRTPLTLILTPLEQFLADRTPNRHRLQFQTMHQNANRLLRLINQLLDLSKLESDSLRPDITPQDIAGYVHQVVRSFEPVAVQQRVTLRVESDLTTYRAFFDADILEKVLYNLVANALKFTPSSGSVTVRYQIIGSNEAPELRLEVQDTGIGIPAEHVTHIFDRFYQINGQHQLKKAGTGIGLALTRELVELHLGSIQVESQLGVGTVFVVQLPVYAAAFPAEWLSNRPNDLFTASDKTLIYPEAQFPTGSEAIDARSDLPLVLIVEDHDDLRNYLTDCFRSGYRVLQAANGREALDKAEKEVPDLIISDWLMPDMDGVELCEAIKTDEKTSHVPLILLTSRSSTESRLEGLSVGADDYVTKPFNVEVLRTRAQNLIKSRHRLRDKYSRMLYLQPTDILIESTEEQFLKKVLSFIERHMADPDLDVQRIERELSMSNTQLYRKLKALTGKGGNDLIRSIRLERAKQWLQAGGRQVAEVAYLVGFNDPNYFIRAFRKEFGMPPGEYVRANPQPDELPEI